MKEYLSNWQLWILQNMQLLSKRYGKNNVILNGKTWQSIFIFNFALPPNWMPRTSRLLIILPKGSKIFLSAPERFYLDRGLRTINGKQPGHYFDSNSYNDLSKYNLARFSFHLKSGWQPKIQCQSGTNLLHIVDGLYKGMDKAAKEVML